MVQQPTFAELLKYARRMAGLTQEALAARAGMSARAISDLERGVKHTPRHGTVELLVTALNLSTQERALFMAAAQRLGAQSAVTAEQEGAGGEERTAGRVWQGVTPPAFNAPAPSPLAGRVRECALLERHLRGEGPPLLVLAGEPGIGKTRLLDEAARQAAGDGVCILRGAARRGARTFCEPVLGALKHYIQGRSPVHLRQDLQGCAWLVRLLPELADGPIATLPAMSLSPEQERRLLAEAVARFVTNIAGPGGTLLILDDLQWADDAALDLLVALLRFPAATTPVRMIAAYRDTEAPRGARFSSLLAELAQAHLLTHLALPPLPPHEAGRLLDALLAGAGPVESERRDRVLRAAGGVPFFLVNWAGELRDGQDHGPADGVPWMVRQSIRERVVSLPPAVQTVLELLAVVGGRARSALLSGASAQDEEEILAALDLACRSRLLDEVDGAYQFSQDVIRLVVASDLSTARRTLLSQRLGKATRRQQRPSPHPRARRDGPVPLRSVGSDGPEEAPRCVETRGRGWRSADDDHAYYMDVLTHGALQDATTDRVGGALMDERRSHLAVLLQHAIEATPDATGPEDRALPPTQRERPVVLPLGEGDRS